MAYTLFTQPHRNPRGFTLDYALEVLAIYGVKIEKRSYARDTFVHANSCYTGDAVISAANRLRDGKHGPHNH